MMFRPQKEVRPCNSPCKNGGACEFNAATKSAKCRCTAELSGPTCESTNNYTMSDIIGGVLLVSILIAGAILDATIRHRNLRKADGAGQGERDRKLAAKKEDEEEEEEEET